MESLALVILILSSLIGFIAIFFTTFGTLIIFIGSLIYSVLTNFSIISIRTMVVLLILYLFGEVLEYIFIIMGSKKLGASNAAVVGALVGGGCWGCLRSVYFRNRIDIGYIFRNFSGGFSCRAFFTKGPYKIS